MINISLKVKLHSIYKVDWRSFRLKGMREYKWNVIKGETVNVFKLTIRIDD